MKYNPRLMTILFCVLVIYPNYSFANEDKISQSEERGILSNEIDPADYSIAAYEENLCRFRKEVAMFLDKNKSPHIPHQFRYLTLHARVLKKINPNYELPIHACAFDNGEPVPESTAFKEAFLWSKNLPTRDLKSLQEIDQEYEGLRKQYPDMQIYTLLNILVGLEISSHNLDAMKASDEKYRSSDFWFQSDLVEKADKGDLTAQLEVAKRLETGDRFKLYPAAAYFWFRRASLNGGGKQAQAGMDRLRPSLSKSDFVGAIDIWIRNGSVPY